MKATTEDGLVRVTIEVWLIRLSHGEERFGTLEVLSENTDEPIRNDPSACAGVAAMMNEVISLLMPMPETARVEFRAFGNRVRFYADKEPSEDVLIDMVLNLLRESIQ